MVRKGPTQFYNSEKTVIGNIQYCSRSPCIPPVRRGNELHKRRNEKHYQNPTICGLLYYTGLFPSYQGGLALKSMPGLQWETGKKKTKQQGAVPRCSAMVITWQSPRAPPSYCSSGCFQGLPPSSSWTFQPSPSEGIQKYHLSNLHSQNLIHYIGVYFT